MRILSVEPDLEHGILFSRRGHEVTVVDGYDLLDDVANFDMVLMVGGADVDPIFYNESPEAHTWVDQETDLLERAYLDEAVSCGVPVVGICKGAQHLCVKAGGKLIQHVNGHGGAHDIILQDGSLLYTFGNHHQMMDLTNVNSYDLLAYADRLSGRLFEPEVVYFPEIQGLGFQYHPEWMAEDSLAVRYFYETINQVFDLEV